jgi:hypothetical protein
MNLRKFEDHLDEELSKKESPIEALVAALDAIAKDEEACLAAIAEQKEIKANEEKDALISAACSALRSSLGRLVEYIPYNIRCVVAGNEGPTVQFTFHFHGGQIAYTYKKAGGLRVEGINCESHEEAYREFCSRLLSSRREARALGRRQYGA